MRAMKQDKNRDNNGKAASTLLHCTQSYSGSSETKVPCTSRTSNIKPPFVPHSYSPSTSSTYLITMTSLTAFRIHTEYSIERLITWSRSLSHPPYQHMAAILTDKIIGGLTEHVNKYLIEKSKPCPHYDYIVFFSKESTRLLLDARNKMLISSDMAMGPPGLNKHVEHKVELAVRHLFVLKERIRRHQKFCENVKSKPGHRRKGRTHVHGLAKMSQPL